MADAVSVNNASALIHTGRGQVQGIVLTASAGNPLMTLYDNTTNAGTKIFEAYGSVGRPLVILLSDSFAIRFVTGCYLALAANLTCTLWTRRV